MYGQNEVVKDLIAARCSTGRPLFFEVAMSVCTIWKIWVSMTFIKIATFSSSVPQKRPASG